MRRRLTGADSRIEPLRETRRSAVAASADASPGIRSESVIARTSGSCLEDTPARLQTARATITPVTRNRRAQASAHANSGHS